MEVLTILLVIYSIGFAIIGCYFLANLVKEDAEIDDIFAITLVCATFWPIVIFYWIYDSMALYKARQKTNREVKKQD